MFSCSYCDAELKEAQNICGQCFKQVRCSNKECRSFLAKDTPLCLVCGTPTLKLDQIDNSQRNKIKFSNKQTRGSDFSETEIEMDITNEAAENLTETLKLIKQLREPLWDDRIDSKVQNPENQTALPSDTLIKEKELEAQPTITTHNVWDDDEVIARPFFKPHNDELRPTEEFANYLASNITAKDRQIRFTVMYVQAFYEEFGKGIKKEKLIDVIKGVKQISKGSFYKYHKEVLEKHLVEKDDIITPDFGVKQFIKTTIIPEIKNPPQQTKNVQQKKVSNTRSRGEPSPKEIEQIRPWLKEDIDSQFDTVKLENSPSKWGLFVLYILLEEYQVVKVIKSGLAYAYAFNQFPRMPLNRANFTDAIKNLKKSEKLASTPNYEYYLTDAGKEQARDVLENIRK